MHVAALGSMCQVVHGYEHGDLEIHFIACRPLDPEQRPSATIPVDSPKGTRPAFISACQRGTPRPPAERGRRIPASPETIPASRMRFCSAGSRMPEC